MKPFEMEMLATWLFEYSIDYSHSDDVKFLNLTYCGFDILKEHQIIL